MNKLSPERRAKILDMLLEGKSMRSVTRLEGVSLNTVAKLLADAGDACAAYHDEHVRGIAGHRRIECDEIWSFVYAKERNVPRAKSAPRDAGDTWAFTAIDADSKLMVGYLVANTSYVERSNLTMRMSMRRFTRLTNAFSKAMEKHVAMLSLYFLHYNYCRIHKTLRVTPAMEAGLSDTVRDTAWIVGLIEARAPKPRRPKTYRKR